MWCSSGLASFRLKHAWPCILLNVLTLTSADCHLPVVLWHGMGASSGTVGGTSVIKKILEDNLGSYVLSISTGKDAEETYSGFFGNITAQVDSACDVIRSKQELQNGYNGLGLSQGGLFLRALMERCDDGPRMHTLVTLGSPHQEIAQQDLHHIHHRIQQPVKDPDDEEEYLSHNIFLPDINNEGAYKKKVYKRNLAGLERLVLFRFREDFTVVPRDSAWFSKVQGGRTVPLRDTNLYKEDLIGLRSLDERKGLVFTELPGFHMQFSDKNLVNDIIRPYLWNHTTVLS